MRTIKRLASRLRVLVQHVSHQTVTRAPITVPYLQISSSDNQSSRMSIFLLHQSASAVGQNYISTYCISLSGGYPRQQMIATTRGDSVSLYQQPYTSLTAPETRVHTFTCRICELEAIELFEWSI